MSSLYTLRSTPILKRLIPSVYKLWRRGRATYVTARRLDHLWLLYPRSIVDRDLLIWGDWEQRQRQTLLDAARRNGASVFLDVGAAFGLYSILMKSQMPSLDVHALEPHPANRAQFSANLLINEMIGKITVHDCAAGDSETKAHIGYENEKNRGAAAVGVDGYPVSVTRLDTLFHYSGKTIVAKIDTEGHELRVLRGMTALLANNRCFLQVECLTPGPDFHDAVRACGLSVSGQIEHDFYLKNF
jgi:FkbM family methyltransferase